MKIYLLVIEAMQVSLVLMLIMTFAICFVIDPTPTVIEDMTDRTAESYLYNAVSLDNNNSDNPKNVQKKSVDVNHFCLKCNSHSLSLEGVDTSEGKRIQLIDCNDCNFEMQEMWSLQNWFWLKSFSPDIHLTSERWNMA